MREGRYHFLYNSDFLISLRFSVFIRHRRDAGHGGVHRHQITDARFSIDNRLQRAYTEVLLRFPLEAYLHFSPLAYSRAFSPVFPRQNGKAAFPNVRITIPQAEAAGERHTKRPRRKAHGPRLRAKICLKYIIPHIADSCKRIFKRFPSLYVCLTRM